MKIKLSPYSGFCFGVDRAVKMAESALEEGRELYSVGALLHNRGELDRLSARGMRVARCEDVPPGSVALIRAHGAKRAVYDRLLEAGVEIVDATCPCVAKIHKIVETERGGGRVSVIIGSKEHPEVEAIADRAGDCFVFSGSDELEQWLLKGENALLPLSFVAQTTTEIKNWSRCVKKIKNLCTNYKIFDTICNATEKRQQAAEELAFASDAVVVIGDPGSSNSLKLYEVCARACGRTFFVTGPEGLDSEAVQLLKSLETVGITAGASTPARIIKEVIEKMTDENTILEGGESFAEMVEQSIKTLHTGERVTGVVTRITPTDIHVDLGTKHAGFIPVSELSDDPGVKPEDVVKVGDEIEVFVTKVNDQEGIVTLSKKRIDAARSWETIDSARTDRAILEGIVVEDNKGGVVVSVSGVRVFVPASQTGLPKETDMSALLKQKVNVRITEVNRQRRRIIGSIRFANEDIRKKLAAELWENIEVGQVFEGTVRSLTSFGAFIDIGGSDGMAHVTELSWQRVNNPADVLKVGDKVTARVIALDPEKKKISLTLKNDEDNPWVKFTTQFAVGSEADVKIVSLMPFGAFAEVLPGVDGLIHISQLSDRRVARPADVVAVGDMVRVRITAIDEENRKISLSIRAILEENMYPDEGDGDYESE